MLGGIFYYLSNSLVKYRDICTDQVHYLNKILHRVDWYCEIELPEHSLGSVLGELSTRTICIYQGTTIDENIKLSTGKSDYLVLGDNMLMYSNAKILGTSHIGNNIILGANTYVIDENIPDNSVVFGQSPEI